MKLFSTKAYKEIKFEFEGKREPFLLKFSDDVRPDDIEEAIREALDSISAANNVMYDILDVKNSRLIDLRKKLPVAELDTLVLSVQGKSLGMFVPYHGYKHYKSSNGSHAYTEGPDYDSVVYDGTVGRRHYQISKANTDPTTGKNSPFADFDLFCLPRSNTKLALDDFEISTIQTKPLRTLTGPKTPSGRLQSQFSGYQVKTSYSLSQTQDITTHFSSSNHPKTGNPEPLSNDENSSWNTCNVALASTDGADRNIYSFKTGHPPFTYSLAGYRFNPNMSPPKYLPYEEIRVLKNLTLDSIFQGQEITKTGELKITDKEVLKSQEGIVGDVLKRLAKSIAEGRGVVGVSLPIRIFEPRSLVERITDWWSFAPIYLTPAAQLKDPLERMKHVIAFAMAGLYVSVTPLKPFNPILGETYQGEFPGYGISVYVEHTSHHPPISNFLIVHNDWRFYGRYEFKGELSAFSNSLTIGQEGPNTVEFKDGQKIVFHLPLIHVGGVISGDKVTRYKTFMDFVDKKNKLKSVIKFDPSDRPAMYDKKRKDVYSGLIYQYDAGVAIKKGDEEKMKDLVRKVDVVHGQWLKHLFIGDKKWWDIQEQPAVRTVPARNPLCSDWRFREDLIWVKRGNKQIAEAWKLYLEERQRAERRLREAHKKSLGKK